MPYRILLFAMFMMVSLPAMAATLMPTDSNGKTIPVLSLRAGAAHSISSAAVSARNTVAFDTRTMVISIYSTDGVYVNLGDSAVVATTSDHYFPAGLYYDIGIGRMGTQSYSHIAVLRGSTDGTVYISEKE